MRLKNWLLAGTSIGLLAFAPISAHAQDAELQSAYQAYLNAQASGDAAALEEAQTALTELCIVGGYTSLEECIAAIEAAGTQPAAEEPAAEDAAPAEQPAPAEDVAPTEAPVAEEPAAEQPPAQEEPVVQEQPVEEPAAEQPKAEEPATEPAPAKEEPSVNEEPMTEQAPAEEAPVAQEATPAQDPATADPAITEDASIEARLIAQVDAHNAAVADLSAGADATEAQSRIDAALDQITVICGGLGYADIEACLAEYGLELTPLPESMSTDEQPAAPAPGDEQPAAPAPGDEQPAPAEETTSEGEPAEVIEDLPEGVTQDQVAPVLDSAKDEEAAPSESAQPVEGEAAAAEEPAAPPPANDEEAQSEATRAFSAQPIAAVTADEGEAVRAEENATVNQTVINNYVTNITTNVTGDNNTVTTGSQQTPVTVVEAPKVQTNNGDAFTQLILQVGTQLFVNSVGLDTDRFYDPQEDEIYYERLSNNRVREVITRPDGTQIITVRNRNGDILRRSRIAPDGREYILAYFDDSYYDDLERWRDPAEDLPPLRLNIPVREYVLDARYADEEEVEVFFSQPPVEQVARLYSIDEVKRSARLRDSVRRLEVGNLTFDTGEATIERSQVQALSSVANAMLSLLERNPNETFLIEGHTDAIGSDIANLRLSDLRAATVARVLTDFYGVPPENLATQGYGERYLKIRTEAAERQNRRVTIRRITPLITVAAR
ncbi:outer membrane protein OmpA-like peptidoglycan-associated protein [Devosia subaequoris]|uniref:Outer membrane protein OmpA-like peptidoglycan-associated protein n=1 Tax=Devosia subaequoris TaxID=395930 RepID=A0A7W6ILG5_9HYPH|nr:OmpA family protein [Devosia subaequoris]MBB4051758.1 outer membrane protein OmpA-like peptidoglycan-associated protein [Devosia subaequoris]MCP1210917.1 OmpA family protein [Devosia subaequoris]